MVSSVLSSTAFFHQSEGTKCPWAAFWMHTNSFLATFSSRNSKDSDSVSDWFDLPLKRKPLTPTPLWSWLIPLMKSNNPQQQHFLFQIFSTSRCRSDQNWAGESMVMTEGNELKIWSSAQLLILYLYSSLLIVHTFTRQPQRTIKLFNEVKMKNKLASLKQQASFVHLLPGAAEYSFYFVVFFSPNVFKPHDS